MLTKISILTHLLEIKRRIIYSIAIFLLSFSICYYYINEIYNFLLTPLAAIYFNQNKKLIYTGLTEAFLTYLKLAYFTSLFITIPFVMSQFYLFITPALYKKEKRIILPYLICAPLLFFIGAISVYYFILPVAWKFFISFEQQNNFIIPLQLEAKISEYLELVIQLVIAFGIAFQLPVLLLFMIQVGLIDIIDLKRGRKFAIVIIFIIAAVITPPDVISQIGLAIPMLILYELAIIIGKYIQKKELKSD